MFVIIGVLQIDTSDNCMLCKQQWAFGDSFKIKLEAPFLMISY